MVVSNRDEHGLDRLSILLQAMICHNLCLQSGPVLCHVDFQMIFRFLTCRFLPLHASVRKSHFRSTEQNTFKVLN
jgi:hypothetical protein